MLQTLFPQEMGVFMPPRRAKVLESNRWTDESESPKHLANSHLAFLGVQGLATFELLGKPRWQVEAEAKVVLLLEADPDPLPCHRAAAPSKPQASKTQSCAESLRSHQTFWIRRAARIRLLKFMLILKAVNRVCGSRQHLPLVYSRTRYYSIMSQPLV